MLVWVFLKLGETNLIVKKVSRALIFFATLVFLWTSLKLPKTPSVIATPKILKTYVSKKNGESFSCDVGKLRIEKSIPDTAKESDEVGVCKA